MAELHWNMWEWHWMYLENGFDRVWLQIQTSDPFWWDEHRSCLSLGPELSLAVHHCMIGWQSFGYCKLVGWHSAIGIRVGFLDFPARKQFCTPNRCYTWRVSRKGLFDWRTGPLLCWCVTLSWSRIAFCQTPTNIGTPGLNETTPRVFRGHCFIDYLQGSWK